MDGRWRPLLGGLLLLVQVGSARAVPSPGGPSVRLPEGEFASDAWDLVARFDTGHLVFSQAVVTNIGWGDHKAAVVGLVVTPDGKVQVFRRSEERSGWKLSRDGLRMDLKSIVFDRRKAPARLDVGKDEFELHVEWQPSGEPVWPAELPQRCPIEVHEIASEAKGSLWNEGMTGPSKLPKGQVALTHRWTAELEASCLLRRTELFLLESDVGVYFTELTTSTGAVHRWLALRRDGKIAWQGAPQKVALQWRKDASGFPSLRTLEVAAPGLSLRVEGREPFFRFDLLDRVPVPFRSALATRTRPRLLLSRASYILELTGAAAPRKGSAVVKLDYTNPVPAAAQAAPAGKAG
jgi:hypothetical protein